MFFNNNRKIKKLLIESAVLLSENDELYARARLLLLSGEDEEVKSLLIEGFQKGYPKCKYFLAALVKCGKIVYNINADAILEEVFPIIEKLSKNADDEATTILYYYYKNGYVVEKDLARALEYCQQATGRGYYLAYLNLANECASSGMANSNTVEFLYEKAAKTEPVVQFFVSSLFENGKGGVSQNQEKSLYWLKKAVEGGDKRAQATLASYHIIGDRVEKNLTLARELAEKSKAQNYYEAEELLQNIKNLELANKIQADYSPFKVFEQMNGNASLPNFLNAINKMQAGNFPFNIYGMNEETNTLNEKKSSKNTTSTENFKNDKPFAFISYAHKDSSIVLKIVNTLRERGVNVWYDNGIEAGSEWPTFIAQKLKECDCMIVFVSKAYSESDNCLRELTYAQKYKKPLLCVFIDIELDDLPCGIEMQLINSQNVEVKNFSTIKELCDTICKASMIPLP